ncbi:MAG: 2-amino-4-hydroxy-6-hydroxymethyldihydropteridine diphosphokinase [Candidatus Cyclobacteriaceae bacterium M2_1C_046]
MVNGKFLLLGGNVDNPEITFKKALELFREKGITVIKLSSCYRTAAWGIKDQPDFLNQVVQIETDLTPEQLLQVILSIEQQLGRKRQEKWGPRLIDIDILYYDQIVMNNEDLSIPHPEIENRRFTLAPLAEIAPDFIHPVNKKSQQQLLALCKDPLPVNKIN